jgi:hypothetical protein
VAVLGKDVVAYYQIVAYVLEHPERHAGSEVVVLEKHDVA